MTFYTKKITAKCFEQKLSFITKTRENHTRESHQSHEVPRGTGDNLLTILTSIVTSFLFISEDNLKDNNYLNYAQIKCSSDKSQFNQRIYDER